MVSSLKYGPMDLDVSILSGIGGRVVRRVVILLCSACLAVGHAFFIKSIKSSPKPDERASEAFLFARRAARPPCLLAFALFLLLEFAAVVILVVVPNFA